MTAGKRDKASVKIGFDNWNLDAKAQLYAKVDNVTNVMSPDAGAQTAANSIYDVVGRMVRIGIRYSN